LVERLDEQIQRAINTDLMANKGIQQELMQMFSNEPAHLRQQKEMEEFREVGIRDDNGVLVDIASGQPASSSTIQTAMSNIEKRMLTEANPKMEEMGYEFSNDKIVLKIRKVPSGMSRGQSK